MDKIDAKCLKEYRNVISTLQEVFDRRFRNFDAIEREFKLFSTPFADDVECVSEELQTELVDL